MRLKNTDTYRITVIHPGLAMLLLVLTCGHVFATEPEMTQNPITTESATPENPQHTQVRMTTTHGEIIIELNDSKAPKSVKNFLNYVKNDFYDNTIFHRVIPNFMIQGGGFTESMMKKPAGRKIINEADNGLDNTRGTIAMARTPSKDSATSQFFINLVDNHDLDHNVRGFGYAVFGKVIKGMDVVDSISAVPTVTQGVYDDVPSKPIKILDVEILRVGEPAPSTETPTNSAS